MEADSIIMTCSRCGTRNRIPKGRLDARPVCAKCRNPLVLGKTLDYPVTVTDQTFPQHVLSFPGPVVLDC